MTDVAFDVIDEATVEASCERVLDAIVAEYTGQTTWMAPHVTSRIRRRPADGEVGTLSDAAVRGFAAPRFTIRLAEVDRPNCRVVVEYVDGDFLGRGEWSTRPSEGAARVRYHWQARPGGMRMRLVSRLLNVPKIHSYVMQNVLRGLASHLRA